MIDKQFRIIVQCDICGEAVEVTRVDRSDVGQRTGFTGDAIYRSVVNHVCDIEHSSFSLAESTRRLLEIIKQMGPDDDDGTAGQPAYRR